MSSRGPNSRSLTSRPAPPSFVRRRLNSPLRSSLMTSSARYRHSVCSEGQAVLQPTPPRKEYRCEGWDRAASAEPWC